MDNWDVTMWNKAKREALSQDLCLRSAGPSRARCLWNVVTAEQEAQATGKPRLAGGGNAA